MMQLITLVIQLEDEVLQTSVTAEVIGKRRDTTVALALKIVLGKSKIKNIIRAKSSTFNI